MKKQILALLVGSMLVASAAFAADGAADFRLAGGSFVGFSYDADMSAHHVTGWLNRHGNEAVDLVAGRAGGSGWSGQLGMVSVSGPAAMPDANGDEVIEFHTMDGIFDYTIKTDHKGNVDINTVSPHGNILTAALYDHGQRFSVGLERESFEVVEDQAHPGHYDGTYVHGAFNDSAMLRTEGSLDLRTVAAKDKTLFVLLYVLPFHLDH